MSQNTFTSVFWGSQSNQQVPKIQINPIEDGAVFLLIGLVAYEVKRRLDNYKKRVKWKLETWDWKSTVEKASRNQWWIPTREVPKLLSVSQPPFVDSLATNPTSRTLIDGTGVTPESLKEGVSILEVVLRDDTVPNIIATLVYERAENGMYIFSDTDTWNSYLYSTTWEYDASTGKTKFSIMERERTKSTNNFLIKNIAYLSENTEDADIIDKVLPEEGVSWVTNTSKWWVNLDNLLSETLTPTTIVVLVPTQQPVDTIVIPTSTPSADWSESNPRYAQSNLSDSWDTSLANWEWGDVPVVLVDQWDIRIGQDSLTPRATSRDWDAPHEGGHVTPDEKTTILDWLNFSLAGVDTSEANTQPGVLQTMDWWATIDNDTLTIPGELEQLQQNIITMSEVTSLKVLDSHWNAKELIFTWTETVNRVIRYQFTHPEWDTQYTTDGKISITYLDVNNQGTDLWKIILTNGKDGTYDIVGVTLRDGTVMPTQIILDSTIPVLTEIVETTINPNKLVVNKSKITIITPEWGKQLTYKGLFEVLLSVWQGTWQLYWFWDGDTNTEQMYWVYTFKLMGKTTSFSRALYFREYSDYRMRKGGSAVEKYVVNSVNY